MTAINSKRTLILIFTTCLIASRVLAEEVIGKVIDSYVKNDVTHCTIETRQTLVSGNNISLANGVTLTVGELMGDKDGVYYYAATAEGKQKVPVGTDVFGREVKSFIKNKEAFIRLERKTTFAPKKYGEVTAVQNDRAMIDKGSLHEVRERDLYAVYDSSGHYKGKIEMRGVGDFQSSGKMYASLEDIGRSDKIEPGDKVKYLGQRKLFGLGLVGGYAIHLKPQGNPYGGGLLWSLTFPDGWAAEVLFGGYAEQVKSDSGIKPVTLTDSNGVPQTYISVFTDAGNFLGYAYSGDAYDIKIFAPIMIKKFFFYPRIISPSVGVGAAFMTAEYEAQRTSIESIGSKQYYPTYIQGNVYRASTKKETLFPIFSAGFTLFPGYFCQVRADAQYFMTPDLDLGFAKLETRRFYYTFGVSTNW